jgi:hypothetical protein
MRANLLIIALLFGLIAKGWSQPGLCGAPYSTFFSSNIFFGQDLNPTLDGATLPFGSYIIAVYGTGNSTACAGYIQWNGYNSLMVVNGADGILPGYLPNEPYRFLVQLPNGCIIDSVKVHFVVSGVYTNPGVFLDGGLSKVDSLHAVHRKWIGLQTTTGYCGPNTAAISTINTGFGPSFHYVWSNGDTLSSISNLPDGAFSVTVTDAYGCSIADTASVYNIPALALQLQSGQESGTNTCHATVSVAGGTAPFSYAWSNGQTGAMATGLPGGPYSVTVTDANGCSAVKTDQCTTVGITEIAGLTHWSATPNPTDGRLSVTAVLSESMPVLINLQNTLGQLVFTKAWEGSMQINTDIDLNSFPPGVYFLQMTTRLNDFSKTIKIIKQ